ncbi:hypothetical protein [Draconibacterium orientale]|uniref:hypothetical protein n=1 Tax=Draconibacterium orientale TaxID=1168034 RepID=UPI0029C01DF9|nr:hypothetical protein [Draconibacterium orientale]
MYCTKGAEAITLGNALNVSVSSLIAQKELRRFMAEICKTIVPQLWFFYVVMLMLMPFQGDVQNYFFVTGRCPMLMLLARWAS